MSRKDCLISLERGVSSNVACCGAGVGVRFGVSGGFGKGVVGAGDGDAVERLDEGLMELWSMFAVLRPGLDGCSGAVLPRVEEWVLVLSVVEVVYDRTDEGVDRDAWWRPCVCIVGRGASRPWVWIVGRGNLFDGQRSSLPGLRHLLTVQTRSSCSGNEEEDVDRQASRDREKQTYPSSQLPPPTLTLFPTCPLHLEPFPFTLGSAHIPFDFGTIGSSSAMSKKRRIAELNALAKEESAENFMADS